MKKQEEENKLEIIQTSFYEDPEFLMEQIVKGDKTYFLRYCKNTGDIDKLKSLVDWENQREIFPICENLETLSLPPEITEKAIRLPDKAEDFGSVEKLVERIQNFIHDYLDIQSDHEIFATYYILLSWVYDRINTLSYLRALGDTGSGKSRYLDTVGLLCYKPMMVSGAVTPGPIHRLIKKWKGTLILDEADLRDSSEKDEVIKILNCGFERGRPVIKCNVFNPDKLEFSQTFCPKVLATRFTFFDKALESRCLTCKMRQTNRKNIPSILTKEFYKEQEKIRNQLLMFRFKYKYKLSTDNIEKVDFGSIEPRLKQTASSFAIFADMPELINKFKEFLKNYNTELVLERSETFEGMIINSLVDILSQSENLLEAKISSQDIANKMVKLYTFHKDKEPTPQKVGKYLKSLGFKTGYEKLDGSGRRVLDLNPEVMTINMVRYVPEVSSENGKNGENGDEKVRFQTFQVFHYYVNLIPNETNLIRNNNVSFPISSYANETNETNETNAIRYPKTPQYPLQKENISGTQPIVCTGSQYDYNEHSWILSYSGTQP